MLRTAVILSALVLPAGTLAAQESAASGTAIEIQAAPIFRVGALQWSIAGTNYSPNILSELTWWNLLSPGAELSFRLARNHFVLRGNASVGPITSGLNTDYDYAGNDRTAEITHSENHANGGMLADARMSAGYWTAIRSAIGIMYLEAAGGLFASVQDLIIDDSWQYTSGQPATFTSGIVARYDASWLGPWVDLRNRVELGSGVELSVGIGLYGAFYLAAADWINISTFLHPVSFREWAGGGGFHATAGLFIPLQLSTGLEIGASYRILTTVPGRDELYTTTGTVDSVFNGATWRGAAFFIRLGARGTVAR